MISVKSNPLLLKIYQNNRKTTIIENVCSKKKKREIKTHVSPSPLFLKKQEPITFFLFQLPPVHYLTTRIVQKQFFHVRARQTFMQSSFYKVKRLIFGVTLTCKQLVRYIKKYNEQKIAVLDINNDIVSNYMS
jgi:hypothetical protein